MFFINNKFNDLLKSIQLLQYIAIIYFQSF